MQQTTIKRQVTCKGVGLHGGKEATLTLCPAAEDTGIVFHVPGKDRMHAIAASPNAVIATELATTLGVGDVTLSTVEHLLAALRGLQIDNIIIRVDGGEVPIMDGSAAAFVGAITKAGIVNQSKSRMVYRFSKPLSFENGNKSIRVEPYDGFFVDYLIDFPHPAIGRQRMSLELTPAAFSQVAKARTFGFLKDVEFLQSRGQALGGSLDNAVVIDENGVINPGGLRYPDEFVRHKILDFIGDMAMLDLPLQGRFTVERSGHSLNNAFLRHAFEVGALRVENTGGAFKPVEQKHRPLTEQVPMTAMAG